MGSQPESDKSTSDSLGNSPSLLAKLKPIARRWKGVSISASTVAGVTIASSFTGVFQQMEWSVYDRFIRLRPQEVADSRFVIVTIDETDIEHFGKWPLSDTVLAQTIERIERQKPRAIGLDVYRDLPVEPGNQQLTAVFRSTKTLIGIEKALGSTVPPSPILQQEKRVALADLVLDADGKVRRALLSAKLEDGQTRMGLGASLALKYLKAQGVEPQNAPKNAKPGALQLGKATFVPFQNNDGSYVRADAGGYQILLNYRGTLNNFQTIAIADVVAGRVPSQLFRDRIVLIGSTAESLNDRFQTPYSDSISNHPQQMPGVVIHANIASQIVSSALDGRFLLQVLSAPQEWLWIFCWSFVGAAFTWKLLRKNPIRQNFVSTACLTVVAIAVPGSILLVGAFLAFLGGWWLPTAAPLISLSISSLALQGYRTSELQRQASFDGLTQVANRRYFNEYIEQQWYRHLETAQPLSLVFCDVDHFKLYNDTYGHMLGDNCLQQVAKAISQAVRSSDLVARYGGEEFVVVLPNTNHDIAMQIAERVNTQVRNLQVPHAKSSASDCVTLSCGVATTIPQMTFSVADLIVCADGALYKAKQKGRNCVVSRATIDSDD